MIDLYLLYNCQLILVGKNGSGVYLVCTTSDVVVVVVNDNVLPFSR